jgi:hypothetical protein
MDGIDYPAPPPSRTDNAILPQVSAESYKKGGSLSQGFSLALPSGRARLPSNKRETPARLGRFASTQGVTRNERPSESGPGLTSIPFVGLASNVAVRPSPGVGRRV